MAGPRKPPSAESNCRIPKRPKRQNENCCFAEAAETSDGDSHGDSAREILELLELELGALVRQLERAASSVAGGAQSTATTLSTIRQRTKALTGHASSAQTTATTFAQAADKFDYKPTKAGGGGAATTGGGT